MNLVTRHEDTQQRMKKLEDGNVGVKFVQQMKQSSYLLPIWNFFY